MTTPELLIVALAAATLLLAHRYTLSRIELRWQAMDMQVERLRNRCTDDEYELMRRVEALEELAKTSLERRSARARGATADGAPTGPASTS
jgi:hypothetical protein